jgi:hypothetical protein
VTREPTAALDGMTLRTTGNAAAGGEVGRITTGIALCETGVSWAIVTTIKNSVEIKRIIKNHLSGKYPTVQKTHSARRNSFAARDKLATSHFL